MAVQSAQGSPSVSPSTGTATAPAPNTNFGGSVKPHFIPSFKPPSLPNIRPFFSPTRLILLFTVVILLFVTFFFLDIANLPFVGKKQQAQKQGFIFPINVLDVKFPSDAERKYFVDTLKKAEKEKDTAKRYEFLEKDFSLLKGYYVASHDPSFRKQAEIYAGYMAREYPREYEKNKDTYTVGCLDNECTKVNYPKEIDEVKNALFANTSIDKTVLSGILRDFEGAAAGSNKDVGWSFYSDAFQAVNNEYKRTGDRGLGDAAQKIKGYIKANFADYFNQIDPVAPEVFKVGK